MPRDLDLTFDISTGALTLDRVVGNYVKRSETLTLSVTIVSNGASATIPAGLVGTLKPVNTYGTTLAQWTTFSQVGATNVYTASTTINAAAVTTLLGTTTEQAYCVFDFAGAGVVESDTLALVLKNNVTRDDDTAPTALLNRNDFLVTNGTGLLINVAAGYAANGAFVAAQSSLAITNATNYIEVTAAGVASVNTTAFTAGSYPLATVVASAGAITSNTDLRAWITPKPGASGGVSDGDKGDITVSNSGATWTIDNDTITLAKLAHMPTARVLGRTTAGTGTPELLTISGTGSVAMTTSPSFTTPDLGTPSAIVLTNASGTASININGTVGATTPSTVAGTTGTFSGAVTGLTFNAVKLNLGLGNDSRSIALGDFALASTTTGLNNYAFGRSALNSATTGSENVAFGGGALSSNVTGDENTAVGTSALLRALGSRNVALGHAAGAYETGDDSLYIDNQDRTNTAGDKANALIYGTFAGTAASQQLTINAGTVTLNGSAVTAASYAGAGTGLTGTASGLTAGNATLAATVTVANEATDTTCFPLFATAATGSLAALSNAGLTFNSATGLLSANGLAGAFNGTVGATTPAAGSFTTLTASSTTSLLLGTAGSAVGNIGFNNATSGTTTLEPATGALGTGTVTLPLTGTLATLEGTETFTNKRITQRSGTATSSATPTINTDNVDFYSLTAQAADITSFSTNLSGTPTEGQTLWIAITGTAARAITWGATFEAGAVALPTTTVSTDRLDVAFIWNTVTSKWRCMASG